MKDQKTNVKSVRGITFGALGVWFVAAFIMGLKGSYQAGADNPPRALGLTLLVPTALFVLSYWISPALRAFLRGIDLRLVTGLHVWRLIGFDFLFHYAQGRLPAGFALPAGLGDILIGFTAVPLASALSRNAPAAHKWFVAWNVFGLIDLIAAVTLGILHSESSVGILAGSGPTTLLLSQFPRSLIPTFFVPVFMLLHVLALVRRRDVTTERASSQSPQLA